MMIKRLAILTVFLLAVNFGTTAVAADEPSEGEIASAAGVTPDSALYRFDRMVERLQVALIRNPDRLASLEAKFALERASEAAVMSDKGKTDLAAVAAAEHFRSMSAAASHLQKAMEKSDKAVRAVELLGQTEKKSQAVLARVMDRAPEEAREALAKALENQSKSLEKIRQVDEFRSQLADVKQEIDQARRAVNAARKSGDEAALKAAQEQLQAAEALRTELQTAREEANRAREQASLEAEQASQEAEEAAAQSEKAAGKPDQAAGKPDQAAGKPDQPAGKPEQAGDKGAKSPANQGKGR